MTIKKFQGKTEEEATAKAREEFGEHTVIMNVKEIKPKGLFRSFRSSTYEVTAAIEEVQTTKEYTPLTPIGNINMTADEPISIPRPAPIKEKFETSGSPWGTPINAVDSKEKKKENDLEEKLESLQSLLEKKLGPQEYKEDIFSQETPVDENLKFVKMIYNTLLENEVDEKYVNQIMDEVETVMKGGASIDLILSSIYQKMILKFGQPQSIELTEKKPKVVFFIGPTGVGKTTTIAKIASHFKVEKSKKVALFTADTYRIAAAEQLRTYANILDTPLNIIYSPQELKEALKKVDDYDLVFVDTSGFSHKNEEQRDETKTLIEKTPKEYEKEVYLVLSATTKYKDLIDIANMYQEHFQFRMIFTKLDETSCFGNILNMKLYTGADLSYITSGQNVPDDIEIFDTQKIVKFLLGGK